MLAKSPLTPVRTPDDDVQLPFIDLGSERDRSPELFGRVSADHDNAPLHGLTEAPRFPQTTTVSWKRGRSRSSELVEQQPADGVRSLAVREMSDTVEHYPSIGVKVMREPGRFRRRVAEVGASLDYQRRHGQVVDRVEAHPELVVSGSTGSAASKRDRWAFSVIADQSGWRKTDAGAPNSASSNQPAGLHVSH